MKKKVLSIILIVLLLLVIALNVRKLIINKKIKDNAKVADKIVSNINKDKSLTIILEINPKIELTLKNDKVDSYKCLNTDCDSLNKDFIGKDLQGAVEFIYNDSKEKGFDTKEGVKLYSDEVLDVKLPYVTYLDLEETNNEVSTDISELEKQLNELKKDSDYGTIYECTIIDNNLSCYIKGDIEFGSGVVSETLFFIYADKLRSISRVLTRFGIKNESVYEMGVFEKPAYYIYINGIKFVNLGGETTADTEYIGNENCSDHRFKLTDLDLLNPGKIKEKFYNNIYFDIINNPIDPWRHEREKCYPDGVCYYLWLYNESHCDLEKGFRVYSEEWETHYLKSINGGEKVDISLEEYVKNTLYETKDIYPFDYLKECNVKTVCDLDYSHECLVVENNTGDRFCKFMNPFINDWQEYPVY